MKRELILLVLVTIGGGGVSGSPLPAPSWFSSLGSRLSSYTDYLVEYTPSSLKTLLNNSYYIGTEELNKLQTDLHVGRARISEEVLPDAELRLKSYIYYKLAQTLGSFVDIASVETPSQASFEEEKALLRTLQAQLEELENETELGSQDYQIKQIVQEIQLLVSGSELSQGVEQPRYASGGGTQQQNNARTVRYKIIKQKAKILFSLVRSTGRELVESLGEEDGLLSSALVGLADTVTSWWYSEDKPGLNEEDKGVIYNNDIAEAESGGSPGHPASPTHDLETIDHQERETAKLHSHNITRETESATATFENPPNIGSTTTTSAGSQETSLPANFSIRLQPGSSLFETSTVDETSRETTIGGLFTRETTTPEETSRGTTIAPEETTRETTIAPLETTTDTRPTLETTRDTRPTLETSTPASLDERPRSSYSYLSFLFS